jgi:hypothetical protein
MQNHNRGDRSVNWALYTWRTLNLERHELFGMTNPFGTYSFGMIRSVQQQQ